MVKFCRFSIILVFLFFSCAGLQPQHEEITAEPELVILPQVIPQQIIPLLPPEKPPPPDSIMGKGRVDGENLALFLEKNNFQAQSDFVRTLSLIYIEEAEYEGVNHDIAFAQMCLETGFLKYGGLVNPELNNFCGLGAIGPQQPGLIFPDPRTGVRAHIQHLKAYATEETLNGELVDPRYRFVRKGSSPTIEGLSGTWAVDKQYSEKISGILERLYNFYFENNI